MTWVVATRVAAGVVGLWDVFPRGVTGPDIDEAKPFRN